MSFLKVFLLMILALYALSAQEYYPNSVNTGMLDELLSYSEVGNLEGTKRILLDRNSREILNLADHQGNTALMLATREGHEDIVLLLLSQNVNINLTSASGRTALIYASDAGYINIVSYLLAKNADVNVQVNNGTTALLQASGRGYESIVMMLLDAGADFNISGIYAEGNFTSFNPYPDMTPLMIAAYNNHDNIVQTLLKNRVDIDYVNEFGATALLYAIGQKNIGISSMLLEAGAQVNLSGIYKSYANISPLSLAAFNGLDDLISPLLIAKADINFQMKDGRTALIWASIGGNTGVIDKLLNFNADINIQDVDGKTALIHAAQSGNMNAVSTLVNAEAFINTEDNHQKTALTYAMETGSIDIINILTKRSLIFRQ
jgi:ankyrin repeat protein